MAKIKKAAALLICCTLFTTWMPAFAVDKTEPLPPSWCAAADYTVFPDSAAYKPDVWDQIISLRKDAASGSKDHTGVLNERFTALEKEFKNDPGVQFELGLINFKYFLNRADSIVANCGFKQFEQAYLHSWSMGTRPYAAALWNARMGTIYYKEETACFGHLEDVMSYDEFTMDGFFNTPLYDLYPRREQICRSLTYVAIDGHWILPYSYEKTYVAEKNDRVLIPLGYFTEHMGFRSEWDETNTTVTVYCVHDVIKMTLGSTVAYKNGQMEKLDVAPFRQDGKAYVPLRSVAGLLGQVVQYSAPKQLINIEEDKSVIGDSNMDAWARAMGSMLNYISWGASPEEFGGLKRGTFGATSVLDSFTNTAPKRARTLLSGSWGVNSREALLYQIAALTERGHNGDFLDNVAYINGLSKAQYAAYLSDAGKNAYMIPYTKELGKKWGDRGIMCWDMFRVGNLVQWGYIAGYFTYAEACALAEPAARKICANFKNWDEAYDNYLDGYNWWACVDQSKRKTRVRQDEYDHMKEDYNKPGSLLDDQMFEQGVTPVPGQSYEQILKDAKIEISPAW